MIGLDTNVLVRYLTQDDPTQSRAASRLIEEELTGADPGVILTVVLLETLWVLGDLYGASGDEQIECVEQLLATRQFRLQNQAAVQRAAQGARQASCEFVDCLIAEIGVDERCAHVFTFDKKAAKYPGFALLKV
ncbi:MAG: PIN domain-containing protein [Betaproteobacteria bacterium]|nr:PIN domain-containing protein [Betaproteobacteria bacterium]